MSGQTSETRFAQLLLHTDQSESGMSLTPVNSVRFWFGFEDWVSGFSQGKQLGQLLDENPALMERRLQYAKRLELYKKARDDIDAAVWVR